MLGSILLDPRTLYHAVERIHLDYFFSAANRRIFATMLLMEREERAIDELTVGEELRQSGELAKIGGVAYLSGLTNGVPVGTPASITEYCRLIREKYKLRMLAILGQQIQTDALSEYDSNDVLENVDRRLLAIRESEEEGDAIVPIGQVIRQSIPMLERLMDGKGIILGTPTGIPSVDNLTAGWVPGDLVILAARPSFGKTALALEFIRRQIREDRCAAMFSLEMSLESILIRLLCRETQTDLHKLRSGFISREERHRFHLGMSELEKRRLWVCDKANMTAQELRWRIRSLAQREKPSLVVVDYVQLLRAPGENRTQQVTNISMELKAAARDLGRLSGGTLLAISQLNRVGAQEKPQLHHLRESGQLEQDADVVAFLSNVKEDGRIVECEKEFCVAKQRNGPIGKTTLVFLKHITGFEEKDFSAETIP